MSRMSDEERLAKINKMLLAKEDNIFIYDDKFIALLEALKYRAIQRLKYGKTQYWERQ